MTIAVDWDVKNQTKPNFKNITVGSDLPIICKFGPYMGLDARKPVFGGLGTTKAQTSLRFRADLSAPLLFAHWKVYLNLLQAKFQIFKRFSVAEEIS